MQEQQLITRKTELSANIVAFCRYLRQQGFPIGPAEQADALSALEVLPLHNPETLRLILKAVLAKNQKNLQQFDALYNEYWEQLSKAVDSKIKEDDQQSEKKSKSENRKNNQPSFQSLKNWLHGNKENEEITTATFSHAKALMQKDFGELTKDELPEVIQLVTKIAKSLATRYQRRYQAIQQQVYFDFRRTLRQNMRRGGDILDIAYKKHKIRRLKLVMLCDVSKSMDLYSRFLVQFIYAFQHAYRHIETFVFSTALHHITDALKEKNFEDALQELSEEVPEWSGGTRIGASFHEFCQNYANKMLDDRTIVLIMSDGWDTGNVEQLAESMEQIHKQAGHVIWLNPLAGSNNFTPTVRGMQAAMPFIDIFASVHNLESLKKLMVLLPSVKRNRKRKHKSIQP